MPYAWRLTLAGILTVMGMGCMTGKYERPREKTEWTISYRYDTDNAALPRALLVGDSICNHYQPYVASALAGAATVSFYASSKCVTDRSYPKELRLFLEESDYAVIHFNNGLHSLSTPPKEWEKALRQTFRLVRRTRPDAALIWCSSTPTRNAEQTETVKALNRIGAKVAAEFGAETNDLFALMDPCDRDQHWTDACHFTQDARKMQAEQVAAAIRAALANRDARKGKGERP